MTADCLMFGLKNFSGSKGARAAKQKKKNRRRKDQQKDPSSNNANEIQKKELSSPEDTSAFVPGSCRSLKLQDTSDDAFAKVDFEDGDIDDGLDPAMKEKLDRREDKLEVLS
ncbi:hypothetical protein ACLOJK_015516 [Asimina triloba]